ncbi:thioesterase family protein, partial [bacterium]|nr:thioesterase family protein [bacterium]
NDGYVYPLAKMNVKYIKPAKLSDILVIKTEIISIEPTLDIKYQIYNKNSGEKIFSATTMQIAIDVNTNQSKFVPPERLKQLLEKNND